MHRERDILLHEKLNYCYHPNVRPLRMICPDCKQHCGFDSWSNYRIDFSTWSGFGELWNWAIKQIWFKKFWRAYLSNSNYNHNIIDPDVFANKIYEYLKNAK